MAVLDRKEVVDRATVQPLVPAKATTMTLEGESTFTLDGTSSPDLGSRALFKAQEDPKQNGLFEILKNPSFAGSEGTFAGAGTFAKGEPWVLGRTADADSESEVTEGMTVPVANGEVNRRTTWVQVNEGPIEVGVSAQIFEEFWAAPGGKASGELEGMYPNPDVIPTEGIVLPVAEES